MSLENTLINTENDTAIIKDKLVNELLNLSKNNEITISLYDHRMFYPQQTININIKKGHDDQNK